jgi:hypothetical protein
MIGACLLGLPDMVKGSKLRCHLCLFIYRIGFVGKLLRHCLALSHERGQVETTKIGRSQLHHLRMPHVSECCILGLQVGLEPDESTLVAHLVAIIWRAKYRDGLSPVRNLVSILLAFMTAPPKNVQSNHKGMNHTATSFLFQEENSRQTGCKHTWAMRYVTF